EKGKPRRTLMLGAVLLGVCLAALLWPRPLSQQAPVARVSVEYDLDFGPSAAAVLNHVYNAGDCPAIKAHFDAHSIPLRARDSANGKPIVGWQVLRGEAYRGR